MEQFSLHPAILSFPDFGSFVRHHVLTPEDLIFTNEYLYRPFIEAHAPQFPVCFQERYGAGEPTDLMVEAILADMDMAKYRRIIAVGGGTVLDVAKLLALKPFRCVDELFDAPALEKAAGLVLIPTTCGTGSEVTNASVVNRTRLGTKQGLLREALYADEAVLIPQFLQTLPYKVFATSSIDALVHAVESYLNPVNNPFIQMFAVSAIEDILRAYRDIAQNGPERRFAHSEALLRASCCAGAAFSNNSCAAVHALSYALGGKYHVPHGESNYQFFLPVLRAYRRKAPGGRLAELEGILARALDCAGENVYDELEAVLSAVLPNVPMRAYGAVEQDVADFADSTMANQQRLLGGSYVPLDRQDVFDIYQSRL